MANSNSFLNHYEILPIAQESKYLGKLTYFIMKLYVMCKDGRTDGRTQALGPGSAGDG